MSKDGRGTGIQALRKTWKVCLENEKMCLCGGTSISFEAATEVGWAKQIILTSFWNGTNFLIEGREVRVYQKTINICFTLWYHKIVITVTVYHQYSFEEFHPFNTNNSIKRK